MGISSEHFPVFMARNERNLFDRKAGLEQTARAFVAKVVKV